MTARLRLFRCRRYGERGTSLVEVMITVLLLGVVLGTVYSGIWSAGDTVSRTGERLQNLDEARTLIAVASKDVRTAVRLSAGTSPFTLADRNEAIFYANLDTTSAPKKVRISIDVSSRLIEQVWTADAGSVAPSYTYTGAPQVRFVGRYVANTASSPMFTYLDDNDNALSATPLSASDRLAIKAVRITLKVKRTSTFNNSYTTMVNRVRLPNLEYSAVAG
jgi:Tfp pilus assembly protein PilW